MFSRYYPVYFKVVIPTYIIIYLPPVGSFLLLASLLPPFPSLSRNPLLDGLWVLSPLGKWPPGHKSTPKSRCLVSSLHPVLSDFVTNLFSVISPLSLPVAFVIRHFGEDVRFTTADSKCSSSPSPCEAEHRDARLLVFLVSLQCSELKVAFSICSDKLHMMHISDRSESAAVLSPQRTTHECLKFVLFFCVC